jgi:hypothetical protein
MASGRGEIPGDLIDEDERGFVTDQLFERVGAGSGELVAGGDESDTLAAADLGRQVLPEALRCDAVHLGEGGSARRGPDERRDLADRRLRQQVARNERHRLHRVETAARGVPQGDEVVGLPSAEVGLQPDDGWRIRAPSGEPSERRGQEVA